MPDQSADVVVVGAGAAGLMAAIMAARHNPSRAKILLLDSRQKIGAKILISGGTRCNVTNVRVTPQDYEGGPSHFVKHVLKAFTPKQTIDFFYAIGVPLVLETSGKYFPSTHSGKIVLEALLKEIERLKITFKPGIKITHIRKEGELFYLDGLYASRVVNEVKICARCIILATGGLSYPETGSDGRGMEIARGLGHSIVSTAPALTPLTSDDKEWAALSGVTMNAKLSFFRVGKKETERKGSFLFTHFGFSGPVVLDISRFISGTDSKEQPRIEASFLPEETEESLIKRLSSFSDKHPLKLMKNFLTDECSLPLSFVEVFLKKAGLDNKFVLKQCPVVERGRLIHKLLNYPLEVSGVLGYKKAEVTAGGVDLKNVISSSMESKTVPGLYFAGEILDVDGRIGGFNFQWAWSTGAIAGRSVMKKFNQS